MELNKDMEKCIIKKVLFIKETLEMIKCTEKEFSITDKINQLIKVNGLKINSMVTELFIINILPNFKMNLITQISMPFKNIG